MIEDILGFIGAFAIAIWEAIGWPGVILFVGVLYLGVVLVRMRPPSRTERKPPGFEDVQRDSWWFSG